MSPLPTGTVTFLFTDIEGSTRILTELGDRYNGVLERHNRIIRDVIAACGGVEVTTEGDSFFIAFASAPSAVRAATEAQRALAGHDWGDGPSVRVRMGLHAGEGILAADNYVGMDVHRAARVASAGHGGQVLLSDAVRALVTDSLPEGVSLRDLGSHRLKDIREPERIWQLVIDGLRDSFPALQTLEARPNNLPPALTPFIGREGEVAEASELLKAGRLLTLTGPGGTGKTRLSIEVAANTLPRFDDGVFFVPLAPIVDPALVPPAIAQTLGVLEQGSRSHVETLSDFLRPREMLLVLDNFEQVVDASPVVPRLLGEAPRLKVLVTSRQPLHVSGEQEYPVPPMAVPDPEDLPPLERLAAMDAVALFMHRAMAVRPDIRLTPDNARSIAAICCRVDGLPLAIELAASRVRLLTPKAILERLQKHLTVLTSGSRDLPVRQQTLHEAIRWSYDLLDDQERTFFRRLSVFSGGCTFEAVEAVCADPGSGQDTLGLLDSLVDKSLCRLVDPDAEEPRFRMLQTIREFAQAELSVSGEQEAVADRHLEYYGELAQTAGPEVTGPDGDGVLARLQAEHDNIRAAMSRTIVEDRAPAGLRMGHSLWRFWHLRGHLAEGRRLLTALLDLPSAAAPSHDRARGLEALASIVYWQNDFPRARECYEQSLEIFRSLGDKRGTADQMWNLAYLAGIEGNYDLGDELHRGARELYTEIGFEHGIAETTIGVAMMAYLRDDYDTALASVPKAISEFSRLGLRWQMLNAGLFLGRIAAFAGRDEIAIEAFRRYVPDALDFKDMTMLSFTLEDLATLLLNRSDFDVAVRLAGAADEIRQTLGGGAPPQLIKRKDFRALARGHLTDDEIDRSWEAGRAMTVEEAVDLAMSVL